MHLSLDILDAHIGSKSIFCVTHNVLNNDYVKPECITAAESKLLLLVGAVWKIPQRTTDRAV